MMKRIAVFIDRDGTINEETGYVDSLDKFRVLPGVTGAIRRLNEGGIPVFMITNQSGVGRGYFNRDFLDDLHHKMMMDFSKQGCHLDGIYVCPHHPDDDCSCRKPRPGMLLKAARENEITLYSSYIIGDKLIDIELAHRVGAKGILVLTGYGAEELKGMGERGLSGGTEFNSVPNQADYVAANLSEAVEWILGQVKEQRQDTDVAAGSSLRSETALRRRILIVKPSSLGDIIHSLPVLWELRHLYPDAHIGWVVKEGWRDIIAGNPLLDEVIVLKKGARGFLSAVQDIRKTGYDMVIDLQGLLRSGLMTILSGASEKRGFASARELAHLFYNQKIVMPPGPIHAVDRYLEILKPTQIDRPHFPLYTDIDDAEWVKDFLIENDLTHASRLIAINPSARWAKKRWPIRSFAALINQLIRELKAGIIILGSKEDIPLAEEISFLASGKPVVAAGKTTLKRLAALLERVDLLITNDSGPMHLAAALGTPVIALFGPTNPGLTGPYGDHHIVIRKEMECSPCLRRPCLHGKPVCMEAITVEEVMEAVKSKLVKE